MLKRASPMSLEEVAQKKLDEFLQDVDSRDFVWMDEILEEAIKMFESNSDGEPQLMPKTPSQKNRQKKKRFSSAKNDQFSKKRLSKRNGHRSSSKRIGQNLQHRNDSNVMLVSAENSSPCCRMTRSRAARSSQEPFKDLNIDLTRGRIPLVEISANERHSAELQMENMMSQTENIAVLSNDKIVKEKSQSVAKASLTVVPDTPETKIAKEGRGVSKLKIANVSIPQTPENKEATTKEENGCFQQETPKSNRRSVSRIRSSMNCRVSLFEGCSLAVQREKMVRKSISRTVTKHKTAQRSSAACKRMSSLAAAENLVNREATDFGLKLEPPSASQGQVDDNLKMSLRSHKASMTTAVQLQNDQQGADCKEVTSGKSEDKQKQPRIIKRQSSYKRALEISDGHYTEDKLSPPRKKAPSPQCHNNKVSRPFKMFLHTVHKNHMLMMTPSSVSRNSSTKSFLKQNTPLRTTPQEKERQRFESLRKKEEAEQQRRQKMEEEKRRRLEEIKRKREERLRKVLQARERVEQMEEEKKKRFEQKLAQHEEKHDKVRDDKMAGDKIKKKAAAKKLEGLEARRKLEEEARKQRALQLEEEERRHKELMQKRKEEEEREKARKIAEQRQVELERERNLSAERELQRKKEQEKRQAQQEQEQQEKEKAARLQQEVLAAAKEKERLRKELEEKERKLQEQQKQEELHLKSNLEAGAKAANKELNVTVTIENASLCNSYQMTPQGPKQPKIDLDNYGMDLNSDDSTDDENDPRKPIPSWATGAELSQAILHQYYNPCDTTAYFGVVKSPKLEEIFHMNKPRYFKRTSSAVWNSPPLLGGKSVTSALKKY